jgi:hypothetical protein
LLLIPQLPAKPAYLRVKVWRRLQAIGAEPLKNAVHALPARPDTAALFDELRREILAGGGEALLLESSVVAGATEDELRTMFDVARDSDYADLAREARAVAEAGGAGSTDLARLRKRLSEIVAIDYFGAHGRQDAEAAVAALERPTDAHPDVSGGSAGEQPLGLLRGRTWVTRRHVHVDRIASAWLIRRFIDPEATFRFVEGERYAAEPGELRFDMLGAEFTHEGDRCTFETLLVRTGLDRDPALVALGEMVHDLDLADSKFARPETAGLGALIAGICAGGRDDPERLARGAAALDDLHAHFSRVRRS